MIITEHFTTRSDGVELIRTYSDAGMMIERDGVRQSEAVDPIHMGRVYTETTERIEEQKGDDTRWHTLIILLIRIYTLLSTL